MSIDFRLSFDYNYFPVIKMDERNELEIELPEDVAREEVEVIKEDALIGQICLLELLAEIRS